MANGLTGDHIRRMLNAAGAGTSGLVMTPDKIATSFNTAMLKYGDGLFTTQARVAALISECMMESAWFRTTEEYAKNGRYAPYIGRGFIQVTWSTNYAAFGKWCKAKGLVTDANYFVNNPKRLADTKWAALTGVWYFTHVKFSGKPLVEYAGNIDQVGKAVNLGSPFSTATPNGQAARRAAYNAVKAIGKGIVPQPPPKQVKDAVGTKDKTVTTKINIYPTANAIHTPFGARGKYWSTDRDKNGNGIHTGDDWHRNAGTAEIGDPIYAVADGRIIYAGDARNSGLGWGPSYGIQVLNTWSHKLPGESQYRTSLDAHMSKVAVRYGQHVKAGDLIGYKGMTGNAPGPHDHHEQRLGQTWGSKLVKPVYPGRTTTKIIEQEGVPVMAAPKKYRRTKDRLLKKSHSYHMMPITNTGKAYSITSGPGTLFVVANIVTDKDCWARFVTVNSGKKGVKYSTRYSRVKIRAGGDQIELYDSIGGPAKGYDHKYLRLEILAYSTNVTVKDLTVRVGKEN